MFSASKNYSCQSQSQTGASKMQKLFSPFSVVRSLCLLIATCLLFPFNDDNNTVHTSWCSHAFSSSTFRTVGRSHGPGLVSWGPQDPGWHRSIISTTRLTTTTPVPNRNGNEEDGTTVGVFQKAKQKFKARPGAYMMIPVIAALVGWITNWLAVQMIFYPIQYRGIPLWIRPEVPLGLIGWQGIVPCKTRTMSTALVEMVTTQLLTVREAFGRLDAHEMANLLAPQIPPLGQQVLTDLLPSASITSPSFPFRLWTGITSHASLLFQWANIRFLTNMFHDLIQQCDSIFSLKDCVVNQMVQDRSKLGELFRKVGQKELDFLTNSGLWFGFLLGLIQMAVALVWENPWSLSIGGMVVGLATNWLALKWIFEPVHPTRVGPFVLQGMFLQRQKEVAAEFAAFFATQVVNSVNIWNSILTDPSTTPALTQLLARNHFGQLLKFVSFGLVSEGAIQSVTRQCINRLPQFLPGNLHQYVDKTLGLETTLRLRMEAMSPAKFERVLHPIFEEDELTLILAGGALGFAAGLIQQGLETGAIQWKSPIPMARRMLGALDGCRKKINSLAMTLLGQTGSKGDSDHSSDKDYTGDADPHEGD
jgi:uncharacterized membrane protein YheB (UPF0754 family)